MLQKDLAEKYIQLKENDIIDRSGAFRYFKSVRKHYLPLQDGCASERNFFDYTVVMFRQCDQPDRDPDFISDSGSFYWYSTEGVIRKADHWGNRVANCDWALELSSGKKIYGCSAYSSKTLKKAVCGYADWKDFIQKSRLFEIGSEPFVTTFENTKGKDRFLVKGKEMVRQLVEVWSEAD